MTRTYTIDAMPAPSEIWEQARAAGRVDMQLIDRLTHGETIDIAWRRPFKHSDLTPIGEGIADIATQHFVFQFRLEWHYRDGRWYIDGTGPDMRGWAPVEGPIEGPAPHHYAMSRLGQMLLEALQPEGTA